MTRPTIFHYRAYLLDSSGQLVRGIEEEFFAGTNGKATRIAWSRAAEGLEVVSGTIKMEFIRRGKHPKFQLPLTGETPND